LKDGIKISSGNTTHDWNQLWVVLHQGRSSRDYALRVNDVIKFGRVRFKVTQVVTLFSKYLHLIKIKIIDEKSTSGLPKKSILDSLKDHMV